MANTTGDITLAASENSFRTASGSGANVSLVSSGALTLGAWTTTGSFNLTSSNAGAITASSAISTASGFTLSTGGAAAINGAITGTGGFTQAGGGTTTLAAANTYMGATTVSAGTLQLGNGTTNGTLSAASAITVASGATLAFKEASSVTVDNAVIGGGSLLQSGPGSITLLATNTYTGATTINGGTLQLGDGSAAGTGTLSATTAIIDNTSFAINHFNAIKIANTISGTGVLSQIGAGVTTLTGANTYSGGTTLVAGTLDLDHATLISGNAITSGAAGTGPISFTNGSAQTLRIERVALGADTAHTFAYTVANFAADGDVIDVRGIGQAATASFDYVSNTLTLLDANGTRATLRLSGTYAGQAFVASSDGAGGTKITVAAPVAASISAALANDTGPSNTDHVTSDPTIAGTTNAGALVTFSEGGTNLGTTTTDANGRYSFAFRGPNGTALLADGTHTITVAESYLGQTVTAPAVGLTLDRINPTLTLALSAGTAVGINQPLIADAAPGAQAGAQVLNAAEFSQAFRIGGTASDANFSTQMGSTQSGAVITFTAADGHSVPTYSVFLSNNNGSYAYAFRVDGPGTTNGVNADLANALTDGTYSVQAATQDVAGNPGVTVAQTLIVDTTADAGTAASLLIDDTTDHVVSAAEAHSVGFTVAGLDSDATALATFADGSQSRTVQIAGNGGYSVDLSGFAGTVTSALAITDIHQNTANGASNAIQPDQSADLAPTASLTVNGTTDGVINAAEATAVTFTVVGLDSDAHATATFTDGAHTQSVQATADGTGSVNLSGFNGSLTSSLAISDTAGNKATVIGNTIGTDTTAPRPPSAPADAAVVNGYVNAAHDTAAQELSGTAEGGSSVTIFDGTVQVGTTTADIGTGVWRYTIGVLADASTHNYTAAATDVAGNLGPAGAGLAFAVDTTAPGAPSLALAHDTGSSAGDNLTYDARLATTLAEAGGTVSYSVDGGVSTPSFDPTRLGDGAYTVEVTQTDAAGNVSAAASLAFIFDRVAPALAISAVSGATNVTDGHVLLGTIDIADAAQAVSISNGTNVLGTAAVDVQGHFTFALPTDMADGTSHAYALSATAVDVAGNRGTSEIFSFILDYGPNQSLFGAVTHDVSSPGGTAYALYDALLNHAPDAAGLGDWADRLAHGESLHNVSLGFLASDEFTANYGGAYTTGSDDAFVQYLYHEALGRDPEAADRSYWISQLANGVSRIDVATNFALSSENEAQIAPALQSGVFVPDAAASKVAHLYFGLLDRAPDTGGLEIFTDMLHNGASLTSVAQAFLSSAEYASLHPTAQTNPQYVDSLYMNALGRPAETTGEQGWLDALNQGASRADVALGIAESTEAERHLVGQIEAGWHLD